MTITAREAAARLDQARRADDDDDRWELLCSVTEAGPAVVRALAEPLLADPDLGETMLGADLVSAMPDVTHAAELLPDVLAHLEHADPEPIDTPQTRALFRENADDEDEEVRQEARAALEALGLLDG